VVDKNVQDKELREKYFMQSDNTSVNNNCDALRLINLYNSV